MTNNRKVLESIPEPASLDRTMPAPPTPAEKGKNLGGITETADSAMRRDDSKNTTTTATPTGASKDQASGSKPASPAAKPVERSRDAAADSTAADAKTAEDESALDSLGRAIGAPLSGEAGEKEPRR